MTKIEEVWKDVDRFHQISNFGRFRSLDHYSGSGGKQNKLRFWPGEILNPSISNTGYYKVTVYEPRKSCFIHRLVSQSFIPNPENKSQVNHKDGNKLNNHVSNLEWCDNLENLQHSWTKLGHTNQIKKTNIMNPMFIKIIHETWAKFGRGSQTKMAKYFNTDSGHISDILSGKRWLNHHPKFISGELRSPQKVSKHQQERGSMFAKYDLAEGK